MIGVHAVIAVLDVDAVRVVASLGRMEDPDLDALRQAIRDARRERHERRERQAMTFAGIATVVVIALGGMIILMALR